MSYITSLKENGIITLTIDRPEALNALNIEMVRELDDIISSIKDISDLKVLVIHGEKNFAAGADIKRMADCGEDTVKDYIFTGTFNRLASLKIPTIAAIEGYALGGGLELALACDLRVASEDAVFGFPEISLGIFPGAGGTIRLPRLVGTTKSKELILLGERFDSQAAQEMGLVNKVTKPGEALTVAHKWAKKFERLSAIAVQSAKCVIEEGTRENNIEKAIRMESDSWSKLFNTEDQKEGMRAFLEKREPVFKDK